MLRFPAWCHTAASARGLHRAGFPLSWRHFCYGMAHLERETAATALERATAMRAARMPDDEYRAWRADLNRLLR